MGLVAGSGWASGVNLYLVVLVLNLGHRAGLAEVPDALTGTGVLAGSAVLFAAEFVADKIPYVDNVWDAVHTLVRPAGGAVLGVLLTGEADTARQAVAAAGGGGLALAGHAAKATARAAINTSPEPASNIAVSLLEDGLVTGVVLLAVTYPALAAVAVAVLVLVGAALTVLLWRAARHGLTRLRARRSPDGNPART